MVMKRLKEIEELYKKIEKLEDIMEFQEADGLLLTLKNEHFEWMIKTLKEQQKKLELATSRDKHALIKANIQLNDEVSELRKKLDRFTKTITEIIEKDVSGYDDDDLPIRPEVSE